MWHVYYRCVPHIVHGILHMHVWLIAFIWLCVARGGFQLTNLPSHTQNAASATICARGSDGVRGWVRQKVTSVQDRSFSLLLGVCTCLYCMALFCHCHQNVTKNGTKIKDGGGAVCLACWEWVSELFSCCLFCPLFYCCNLELGSNHGYQGLNRKNNTVSGYSMRQPSLMFLCHLFRYAC